jgi:YebC/PmpR family DNA-binding regulatory protein
MSGHSKWHNIRVKKTAADAKRGKVYTRHARLIEMAARNGEDPAMNPGLRTAIDNAKADSVPNANIDRAIAKGTGALKGEQMAEVMYAAYGPGGVACLIECLTDNRNRTLSNVKMIIDRRGGAFAETASVQWMFQRKGMVVAKKAEGNVTEGEELELRLIDAGAEDIERADDIVTVTTDVASWTTARDVLKNMGWDIETAGLSWVATQKTELKDPAAIQKLVDFVDGLEEDDDVSAVHTNAAI